MKWMKKTNNIALPPLHRSLRSFRPVSLALALVFAFGPVAALVTVSSRSAAAQNKAPIERVVDGKVTDKADASIAGAVVYLKDSRSLAMKTYITDDAGHFHFGQLSQNTDYEVWAVSNGIRSKSKTISSFDDKKNYNFVLKIDTAK
jgi:hypothetical protein